MEIKLCKECKKELTIENFSASNKSGVLHPRCKECRAVKARQHRKENPDLYRNYEYKKKYKINIDTYNKVLEQQNGVCLICKGNNTDKPLQVDHDHSCCPGEYTCGNCLRGLLCSTCNTGLGSFKENIELVRLAVQYLENAKGSNWMESPWR